LQVTDGLIIKKVTESDEGVYECRAIAKELGDVKSVYITLEVSSKLSLKVPYNVVNIVV
jgi:hypothetical protein